MTITRLYLNKSAADAQSLTLNQSFKLESPATVAGNTVYRKVLFLRLPVDQCARELVIKNLTIAAAFSSTVVDVGSTSTFLKEQGWSQSGDTTTMRFKRAWPIAAVNSYSHGGFSLHRVDGDAVAAEATTSGNTNVTLDGEFVSHEFAVTLSKIGKLKLKGFTETRGMLQQSAGQKVLQKVSSGKLQSQESGAISISEEVLLAKAKISGLNSIGILGIPSAPRIGFVQNTTIDAAMEANFYANADIDWLTIAAGEHKAGVTTTFAADVIARVQTVANTLLAQGSVVGNTLTIPLILEGDAPCACVFNQLAIDYALRATAFADAQAEQTLRFSGAAIESRPVAMSLPAGTIESVSMEINDGAQDDLLIGVAAGAAQRKPSTGVLASIQQTIATRVVVPVAGSFKGVTIAVSALTADAAAEVQIVEDINDAPNGAVLAHAVLKSQQLGQNQFMNVLFDGASSGLILDAKTYWIVLRATVGSMLWTCAPEVMPAQKILLLRNLPSPSAELKNARVARAISNVSLEYGWITARSNGSAADGIDLTFGAQPVPMLADQKNTRRRFLQLPSGLLATPTTTNIALTVTRASAGTVSLSLLQIDYRPPV